MSLWDKPEEECRQIITAYMDNIEKTFGQRPNEAGIAGIIDQILQEKIAEFTRSTFADLTPQTLINCLRILMEEPRVQVATANDLAQIRQKKKKK